MSNLTTEQSFESAIIEFLVLQSNYDQDNASDHNPDLGLFNNEVITFLQQSQPKAW